MTGSSRRHVGDGVLRNRGRRREPRSGRGRDRRHRTTAPAPPAHGRWYADRIAYSELVVIPDEGHIDTATY